MRIFTFFAFAVFVMSLAGICSAAPLLNVTGTFPSENGVDVDININKIIITFNQEMDVNSFEDRFQLDNKAKYDALPTTTDNKSIELNLTAPLAYSTTYTVTVSKRVKMLDGTRMGDTTIGGSYEWSFTTMDKPIGDSTPPTISSTSPVASATGVPTSAQIDIVFSEVMNPASLADASFTISSSSGSATFTKSVDDPVNPKIVFLKPASNLGSNRIYTVTVATGVEDAVGNNMASQYSWQFTTASTDMAPPAINSVSPVNGATSVAVNSSVTATFSEPMSTTTINSSTFTVKSGSTTITGTVAYDSGTDTAIFSPDSGNFINGVTYTATITAGVKDLAGNAMTTTKTWTFTTVSAAGVPPSSDYCQIPPYVGSASSSMKPNVLLLIDNSGSMSEFAYKKAGINASSTYDDSYEPNRFYYGYFNSERMYTYNSTNKIFEPDAAAGVVIDKTSFWSGNFLNWLTMRRVDVVRKVLVGGKTSPRSAKTANYLVPYENPDRDYYKTYNSVKYKIGAGTAYEEIKDVTNNKTYVLKIYVGDDPPQDGLVLRYSDQIRFGIMFFNPGYRFEDGTNSVKDGGFVQVDMGASGTNLITAIEGHDPDAWTPLAETLYEATRYYEAIGSAYNGGTYSGKDPIEYKCQKNFALILTDGESTKDQNIPGGQFAGTEVSDPNGFSVSTWMDSIAAQEGIASQKGADANTSDGTYYLEGVAYYAHNTDFRSDFGGMQNVTTYAVFAFDDSAVGRELLQKTAKYGGYKDYDNTGKPDKVSKWDEDGNGIPDTYFEAQDGDQLQGALLKAFNDILARVSAGTAASILSNSEGSGANVLQAVFYPKKYFDAQTSADWIGEMHSLWYYIDPFVNNSTVREDTLSGCGPDKCLNLGSDRVVNFYFNADQGKTMVKRYSDVNGDGKPDVDTDADGVKDSYAYVDEVDPDNVSSLWRAGKQLWSRTSARNLYTQVNGSLTSFTGLDTNQASILNLLQAANKTEGDKIINFVKGVDQSGYRNRTVSIGGAANVWKLGDIISSTPRLQSSSNLNVYHIDPPSGYDDNSYGDYSTKKGFINTGAYKSNGMAYAGANDGMLHAFKLGTLDTTSSGDKKAKLVGSGLGEEAWAFIPKNVLPYFRYLAEPAYGHIYLVDGTTVLNDVSIGVSAGCVGTCSAATAGSCSDYCKSRCPDNCRETACTSATYWDCWKDEENGSNWRTVLIGSMGLGGASKMSGTGCKGISCVETPIKETTASGAEVGVGYSSYYALDVTNPSSPQFMWEFSDPSLGFSTAGPAFVKIGAKSGLAQDRAKNGHWYAVLASGPTGPIDTTAHQFKGQSNQPLSIFVLDLKSGIKLATFDKLSDGTVISDAFAGKIVGGVIDPDRWKKALPGNYQDDAVYIGYTQKDGSTSTWTKGGVLRLSTGEDPDPANWKLSKLIDNVGPVTTNLSRLQDRTNHNLWLYFGTGRYYFTADDPGNTRAIYGVKEPCYTADDKLDGTCTAVAGALTNRTTVSNVDITNGGWYINLEPENTTTMVGAERALTDPIAMSNGVVFFTTFKPTTDVCSFGGTSHMWAVDYKTGGTPDVSVLNGKALVQVSTGSFEELHLDKIFTEKGGRFMGGGSGGGGLSGKASEDAPPIITRSNLRPIKKILHIQER